MGFGKEQAICPGWGPARLLWHRLSLGRLAHLPRGVGCACEREKCTQPGDAVGAPGEAA